MKRPYISKYIDIRNLSVYMVDGAYIRANLDKEFTNFGQHYRFEYIPENELWLDREAKKGERDFFLKNLIVQRRLMKNGKSYFEAYTEASEVEKKERESSELAKKVSRLKEDELVKKIKKQEIFSLFGFSVWIVSGELIRNSYYIDFTAGGHDKVYDFVPEKEVWLDDDTTKQERVFILIHELAERYLMTLGWPYVRAHNLSLDIEYFSRQHSFLAKIIYLLSKLMNALSFRTVKLSPVLHLKKDGVGVYPTDTIYGLIGSVYSKKAIERIYELKGRDADKGLIVLISSLNDLKIFGIKVSEKVEKFLKKHWPGKLSVVFPFDNKTFPYLDRSGGTLAVRLPNKKELIDFLKKTGPVVAPSANPQGVAPARTVMESEKYFGNNIDFYQDEGELTSEPSTLIKVSDDGNIEILREGAVKIDL